MVSSTERVSQNKVLVIQPLFSLFCDSPTLLLQSFFNAEKKNKNGGIYPLVKLNTASLFKPRMMS